MSQDISKNVVMVLLVLVVVVASLGTFAFMNMFTPVPQTTGAATTGGQVSLTIGSRTVPSTAGADVSLTVRDAEVT